jgi:alpha-methylacyl-CoA racemase
MFTGLTPSGRISLNRERNPLGGNAPYYRTYRCADGLEMAVGAIEPQFWAELLRILEVDTEDTAMQREDHWEETSRCLEEAFASEPRDFWTKRFQGSDSCVFRCLQRRRRSMTITSTLEAPT